MPGLAAIAALRHGSLPWLVAASAVGLLLSSALEPARLPRFCGDISLAIIAGGARTSLALADPAAIAGAWALMVAAMMPPLLAAPLNHVVASSLRRRRLRAAALALIAYLAAWILLGALLVPLGIASRLLLGGAAFPILLLFALGWSASPAAQFARNKGHRLVRIGLRGWRADRDCLVQGWTSAPWCALACWPWMLAALAAEHWHLAAMAAIGLVLLAERLLPAARPRWRLPPILGLGRAAFA